MREMRMRAMLGALVLTSVLGGTLASAATRVAVVEFQNNATGSSAQDVEAATRAITDMMTRELTAIPGLSVFERSRLDAIAREQRLSASGLVDAGTAVQIGRLAGIQWIITGAITEVSFNESGGTIPLFGLPGGLAVGQKKATVAIDVRAIEVETGEVRLALSQRGTADRQMGGIVTAYGAYGESESGGLVLSATLSCVKKAVEAFQIQLRQRNQIAAFRVNDVLGSRSVRIEAGAMNGNVQVGQLFLVYMEGAPVMGVDGRILGTEKTNLAVLKVTDVQPQWSDCDVVRGSAAEIQRGDFVSSFSGDPKGVKLGSRGLASLGSGSSMTPSAQGGLVLQPQQPPVQPQPFSQPAQAGSGGALPLPPPQPVQQSALQPLPPMTGGSEAMNTSEEMLVIDFYPVDESMKNQLRMLHKGGYFSYSHGDFRKAYMAFTKAMEMYDGNYLDAYWAARAAHKVGQKGKMKELLQKALEINPNYVPAQQYMATYGK